jgi:hypothetical protein
MSLDLEPYPLQRRQGIAEQGNPNRQRLLQRRIPAAEKPDLGTGNSKPT